MLRPGHATAKGRAMWALHEAREGAVLLIESPLLCTSMPGARDVCGACLGDAAEYCDQCDEGTCKSCHPHQCSSPPDGGDRELRGSLWYRLYHKYIGSLVKGEDGANWADFARVPTKALVSPFC
mmetsp:Transcript_44204/g.140506  ORF Transcript_44204/g.140506 Transcript_44204/m.140506 type:complete len:124 (-) Transcript_44204:54-425(-)